MLVNFAEKHMEKTNTWTVIVSGILAFFEPIAQNIFSLGFVFVVNLLVGIITATVFCGEKFSIAKAGRCIMEAAVFFFLCASVYVCGKMNGNEQGAINTVSMFVYVILFIYARNVIKNFRRITRKDTPAWFVLDFIYNVLSFEFIKCVPGLSTYIREKDDKDTKNHTTTNL